MAASAAQAQSSTARTTTHPSAVASIDLRFSESPIVGRPIELWLTVVPSQDLHGAWVSLQLPAQLAASGGLEQRHDFAAGIPANFSWLLQANEPIAIEATAWVSSDGSQDADSVRAFFGEGEGIADLDALWDGQTFLRGNLSATVEGQHLVVRATYGLDPAPWQLVATTELKLRERQGDDTVQEPIVHARGDEPSSNELRIPLQDGQDRYEIQVEYQVSVHGHSYHASDRTQRLLTYDACYASLTIDLESLGKTTSPCPVQGPAAAADHLPTSEAPGAPGPATPLLALLLVAATAFLRKPQP